jgi:glucose-1-phosphate thymidylyltransferase
MTDAVNKHLLPVYSKPMIFYPVDTLIGNGIDDILVISGADYIGSYIQLLEEHYDANFSYKVQTEPKGIAHAVSLAEEFVEDSFVVVLGDNIVIDDLTEDFASFDANAHSGKIFLTEVDKPARYGIADVSDGRVTKLEEKPDDPFSKYAVIGIYLYTNAVFDEIREIEPSDRGELEITDVNKRLMEADDLAYSTVDGLWFDAGTPEGLFDAAKHVREHQNDKTDQTQRQK